MLRRVNETIDRYSMVATGQTIGVAVSGGADSTALLHVLFHLAPRWNLRLKVIHVDHGLRGAESRLDAEFVRRMAASLGLPFLLRRADAAAAARARGGNLEETARELRRGFFLELIGAGEADRVATGHTRSDQAETVLFRLLRGAGSAGLAGIRPVTAEGLIRPLVEVDREEVTEYLRTRGIPWREDSSNSDLRFDRNRIRHDLLPKLSREWNPKLAETLARMAAVSECEEAYWEAEVERAVREVAVRDGGAVLLDAEGVARLPAALRRRLLRRVVAGVKGDLRGLEFAHIERLERLACSEAGEGRVEVPGVVAVRSCDRLRLARPGDWPPKEAFRIPVSVPGECRIGGIRFGLTPAGREDESYFIDMKGYNTDEEWLLDAGRLSAALELRSWEAGDRFQPAGRKRAVKLKTLFQRARIPSWERPGWPILEMGGTIIWTRRFGAAEGFAAPAGCRRAIRVRED